jgi:hypothetical protein
MITILLMLATWYVTKIYYTHRFTVKFNDVGDPGQVCFRCAKREYPDEANKRVPYYCNGCK